MKKLIFFSVIGLFLAACGGATDKSSQSDSTKEAPAQPANTAASDSEKGIGKFSKVDVGEKLDAAMATSGEGVYKLKCSSCHKLTDEKLVGPGWKGVTSRHKAEWVMNFVTNTEEMLNKDPKAIAQLEICLVRMPNQNLTDAEARQIYEYMRKNDGVK